MLQIRNEEIGLWFFRLCLFHFLCTHTTWTFFHLYKNSPSFRISLKIIERGLQVEFPHSSIIRILSTLWSRTRELTLREKCPYSELFWSLFSRIRTECLEVLRVFPYSVPIRENADQNNSGYRRFLHSVSG